jgi:hypothetical protein
MNVSQRYRKGQLFLMEVIVAITILFALVTILFSNQQLSPPPVSNNLDEIGNNTLHLLKDSGELYDYLIEANYSYFTLGLTLFDSNNQTKINIHNTIRSSIPILADFKVFVFRYNSSNVEWDQIDIINFESYTPAGSDITHTELYIPGFNGIFDTFRVQLSMWFEVQS